MIDIPPVVSRIEPNNHCEVAKESAPSCIHCRRDKQIFPNQRDKKPLRQAAYDADICGVVAADEVW
jgi:hypothetical protein